MAKKCYKICGVNQDEEVEIMAQSPKDALHQLFPNLEFVNVARGRQWLFLCGTNAHYEYRVRIPMKCNGPAYRYYKVKV